MKNVIYILSLTVVLMFNGCGTMAPIITPLDHVTGNHSLVLGRLNARNMDDPSDGILLKVAIKNLETGHEYNIENSNPFNYDGTGFFAVELPPGKYICYRIYQNGKWVSQLNIHLYFDVVPSSTVYIGTLNYAVKKVYDVLDIYGKERVYIAVSKEGEETIRNYYTSSAYEITTKIINSILRENL